MHKEYKLLEKLYFIRLGGSEEELKACQIVQDELKELGLESRIESFDVSMTRDSQAFMEVTLPYNKRYDVTAYEALDDVEELVGELYYFEQDTPVCREAVKGKIALINGYLNGRTLKALTEAKAIGFISYSGDIDRNYNDLDVREYRAMLKPFGYLPGVHMKVNDAMELVEMQAKEVRFGFKQKVTTEKSYNLICDIKGESDDVIVCSAHIDTVPFSKGAYDNATGSVALYKIAEVVKDMKLKHNVRLIWCGSEERGLIGSREYVKMHKDELEDIKLCVNVDMIGSIMGKRIAVCSGHESLVHYTDYYGKMNGYPMEVTQGAYSSDSTSFAEVGIPGLTFARITHPGTGSIHSCNDVIEHMSERLLNEDCVFIANYVKDLAQSYVIPVPREIPDKVKDDVEKMFGKHLLKKED